ncbi:adenosylcobalamin-dependent ribonucleoside-diphosphate reductase [Cloacibacillus porcorum]|uniref:adenosylcobalamin-dependent ribonucleoside-diphosphate reductase n=1 Tax=Cloacibacillus porcorum TaxID=1197717 RepID=UPI001459D44C|nr:adenosylcobalamin-dependent ribonucleoside-diphosphate reductase [Cloacibacillus porcorum]MCC8183891.1 adenosylcobalamin-dependent ribonucleoside-diphosphate reductase [Cloacibacillus porcorum]MDY5391473.1 adenosylcobalamin-dependent ribonucleoside-diphosphate reductase [Cloacibacillus porcorum]NMF18525.1 adenosylcobalamin-dependent ribonucleoside-diphosphate reductase [Cloacibacillus porcorum]
MIIKPAFSPSAKDILRDRYLWRDENRNPIEKPEQMLERVAKHVAGAESSLAMQYKWADEFYDVMAKLLFLPNSPTLMNSGRPAPHGQLAACFVIGVEDSMEGICEALRKQMLIHKSGGGTGFNFSKLRSEGAKVNSTNGRASGPVSFMGLFDKATETVQQGGMRRGANMGILNIDHPDIRKFIHCKDKDGTITNFNISVGVFDDFMEKVNSNPRGEEAALLAEIADSAWRTGDPGIIFLDAINRGNTTPNLGELTSTNPCGESPLYPNEACNLGSINIAKMVKEGAFDYELLGEVSAVATRFLDDVIDVNHYPLPEIAEAVKLTRKIGLGVMGWADLLFQLRIPYDSKEAYELAENIMRTIQQRAHETSVALGKEKGIPETLAHLGRRNATLTCIAPTGTIALLANCSSGIEPLFALEHTRVRTQTDGTKVIMKQVNRYYEQAQKEGLPEEVMKRVFVTSHDVSPSAHVRMQGVFQRYTDLAVSKTVNLRHECSVQDVLDAYTLAWREGCKGITVYRDGSKSSQVLYRKEDEKKAEEESTQKSAPKGEPVPVMAAARPRFVLKRPQ